MAGATLACARTMFLDNVAGVSLDEALDAGGGFRSILGLMKHTTGWTVVYHSYAFDESPRSWFDIDWPRGLRDRIEPTEEYVDEVREWFRRSSKRWVRSLDGSMDLGKRRPVHWGERWPLRDIIANVATHWTYHAGEINAILAVRRREAWEYGEHVEENHIATIGHSVRRPWITDERVRRDEEDMRRAAEANHPAD
jgi:uncharacterized damage-inducible protein DinB